MKTVVLGLLIPFAGTAAGAACVFFLKKDLRAGVQRALNGFAAGVMVAASIWSLIVPAIEQSADRGRWAFLPAFIGFWLGICFLLLLDHVIPHLHRSIDHADQAEGPKSKLNRTIMMVLAVTLHNIPEGMAVGVVYAGPLAGSGSITAGGALALAL
ncbi:MAG: ZIP family metal transporter, partial [Lachnospiraceae bacterium]|nr:ZIP family metal transporter [Lachnospiraceae bacterium]